MQNRKTIYFSIVILLTVSLILAGMIWRGKNQELKVVFLDVGQGDSILIMQGSNQILIDGGPSEQIVLEKLGKYIPFWDREIEMVMATHPDQDHIQGLMGVLKNYQVDNFMETTVRSESQLDKKLEELIAEKNIVKNKGEKGVAVKLQGSELDILAPRGDVPDGIVKDTNNYSIVAKLVFGKNSFLLTGDLPEKEEMKLVEGGADLNSSVLKMGHHGSKYSSSEAFLSRVSPEEVVISVGKNNRFGHPAPEALERLEKVGASILRTDELGDIAYVCNNPDEQCALIAN